MNPRLSLPVRVAASLWLAAGYAGTVSAHNQGGSLGSKADAIDAYLVACSDDGNGPPARLVVEIRDKLPVKPPLVSVQVQAGSDTKSIADPKDGDKRFSPGISVNGGVGPYAVTVGKLNKPGKGDKTRKHPEIYEFEFHCMSGSGAHTGTDIQWDRRVKKWNQ
jgi:hypothetical protein